MSGLIKTLTRFWQQQIFRQTPRLTRPDFLRNLSALWLPLAGSYGFITGKPIPGTNGALPPLLTQGTSCLALSWIPSSLKRRIIIKSYLLYLGDLTLASRAIFVPAPFVDRTAGIISNALNTSSLQEELSSTKPRSDRFQVHPQEVLSGWERPSL